MSHRQQIVVVVQADIAGALGLRPVGQRLGKPLAGGGGPLGARHFGEAAGQKQLGLVVERAQQLALPAVPDAGPDAADVADGEHQQHLQPLDRLHRGGEIVDRLAVVEVARLGGHRHQQMMLDQPGDGLGIGAARARGADRSGARSWRRRASDPPAALGDVVQQQRDVEELAMLLQSRHQRVDQRMDLLALAALDLGEDADAAQQVLVDRVVVIHVELHHRDDLAEFGDEAAEHAGLVHAAQVELRIAVRGEDLEKQPVGLGVLAQIAADQLERARHQLHGGRVVFEPVLVGEPEQAEQVDRIALEHHLVGDVDAVVVDDEIAGAGELALAPWRSRRRAVEARHLLGLRLLERGAEDAGQVADILGDQEVVLHEALDRRQAGMAGVAEALGDLALDVEMQPLLGLAGEEMHVAAHRPQEILGLAEQSVFLVREDALLDEFLARPDAVEILADPEQRLQVAQAALAVLDVGLDQIAAFADLAVTLVALGELGLARIRRRCSSPLRGRSGGSAPRRALRRPTGSGPRGSTVRIVLSVRDRRMHSSMLRVAWPTFRPRSHSM